MALPMFREEVMTTIKVSAVPSAPACDACGGETTSEDWTWTCQDCGIYWDPEDLSTAYYLDETTPACGESCPDTQHTDDGRWTWTCCSTEGRSSTCRNCRCPTPG